VLDRYKYLGKKEWVADWDSLVLRVRSVWTDAWQEGSTGPERSWWTKDETAPDALRLIGHSFPKKTGGYWLRLRSKV
jgi:hypothetical protein